MSDHTVKREEHLAAIAGIQLPFPSQFPSASPDGALSSPYQYRPGGIPEGGSYAGELRAQSEDLAHYVYQKLKGCPDGLPLELFQRVRSGLHGVLQDLLVELWVAEGRQAATARYTSRSNRKIVKRDSL